MRTYTATMLICIGVAIPVHAGDDAAKAIAPYLDDQTVAVARLDLNSLDIDAAVERFAKVAGVDIAQFAHAQKTLREAIGAFRNAGAKELFAVVSLSDLPNPGPFILVPTTGTDHPELKKALGIFGYETVDSLNTMMFAGSRTALDRLRSLKAASRPGLETAFAVIDKSPVQIAFVPGDDQRRAFRDTMPNLPPQIGGEPSTVLTRGVRWAALGIDIKPKLAIKLVIQSEDAAAAKSLYAVLGKGWAWVNQQEEVKKNFPQIAEAIKLDQSVLQGDRLVIALDETSSGVVAAAATVTAKARAAAARSKSTNNLKQLALAWHNYHEADRAFPKDIMSKDGKPLLSWRVAILPYIEQDALYKQFKLDEPWDSEHNKKLMQSFPKIYSSPTQKVGEWKTTYLSPTGQTGPDGVFKIGVLGARIQDITDGTSNTIMIVEGNDNAAVVWTKPDDLKVDPKDPIKGLIGHYPEGFLAAFADGSVRFIKKSVDAKNLLAAFTRNGGEVVNGNDF